MTKSNIIINNLSFHLEQSSIHFDNINLSFEKKKYGIVGKNGIGKTTFIKLLTNELSPDSGCVTTHGLIMSLPQSHDTVKSDACVSDVLQVSAILHAIQRVNKGDCHDEVYTMIGDNWDLHSKTTQAFATLQLQDIDLSRPFQHLSGGQKTKVLLARALIFQPDTLILDEPTNNLDSHTRHALYEFISQFTKSMIVVSHDRSLLNLVDLIIEINSKGFQTYGGNYDFYFEQKRIKEAALHKELQEAVISKKKAARIIQTTKEKHQRLAGRGKKAFKQGKVDKLTAFSKKGRSEKTHAKNVRQEARIIEQRDQKLKEIRDQLDINRDLSILLNKTQVPIGKSVISIDQLCFRYPQSNNNLFQDFQFNLVGPHRVAITGCNGSGKSTLLKLLCGKLQPHSGSIQVGVEYFSYFDQDVSFLDPCLSIIDNFLALNPSTSPFYVHSCLATFQFRNTAAEKTVASLSGGERMRAGLAVSLSSPTPPQLILLDEPTNHLDIASITAIENALRLYQGAILAVSHDTVFLNNIGIQQYDSLDQ